MKDGERYILTLRPEPSGVDHLKRPPVIRLRAMLKVCLRQFGLRCTAVVVKPVDATAEKALSFPASAPILDGGGRSPLYTSEPTDATRSGRKDGQQ